MQQLLSSMFPLILAYNFVLVLGSFWIFGALMGYFMAGVVFKNYFGVFSTNWKTFVSELPSNVTFVFDLSGRHRLYGDPVGYFWVYSCSWTTFIFNSCFNSVVLSFCDGWQASHSGPNFRQKSEFRLLGQKGSEKCEGPISIVGGLNMAVTSKQPSLVAMFKLVWPPFSKF